MLSEYSGVLHPWKNTVCEHMLVCAIVFCKTDISIIRSETEQFFKYINCYFCFNLPANYCSHPFLLGLLLIPSLRLENFITSQAQRRCEVLMAPDAHFFQLISQKESALPKVVATRIPQNKNSILN